MGITTKIAVVTDDGVRISDHFGRARYYQVFTIEQGDIVSDELRDRRGTTHHGNHNHEGLEHNHEGGHGLHPAAADRHASMVNQITDVSLLITRGMGRGAYFALAEAGIQTAATDFTDTRKAIQAFIDGTLTVEEGRVH